MRAAHLIWQAGVGMITIHEIDDGEEEDDDDDACRRARRPTAREKGKREDESTAQQQQQQVRRARSSRSCTTCSTYIYAPSVSTGKYCAFHLSISLHLYLLACSQPPPKCARTEGSSAAPLLPPLRQTALCCFGAIAPSRSYSWASRAYPSPHRPQAG